ncbi:hypothetical protein C4B68_09995 [Streptomyces dengpaensis]|uniref:Uncharacterized protein n=1 Tax=Streptomyces dengpaensis TaxID=2049881 RepID=A0ABM6SN17_9ACTN|nr:hypothetical protein C4B68_09995 [Streptomyces dengpaensis]PIB06302.1 hypothetical protein B1C81_24745 [Streptomyces sp. HG99]
MASILAYGVAAWPRSDYSAPPDRSDHEAYGIGHMLYSRWPPRGNDAETDGKRQTGHSPAESRQGRPRRDAPYDRWCEHRHGACTDAVRVLAGDRGTCS